MRPVVTFVVITLALLLALGARLWWQNAELHGPAGGAGVIEGTSVVLSARISARVATTPVKEGDAVEAGTVLLTLDCAEPEVALAEAEARLAMARAQAQSAAAAAQATRRSGAASRHASKAANAQADALTVQRDEARRQAERLATLGQDVAAERREVAQAQAQGLEQQVEGALASRQASAEQAAAADAQGSAAEASAAAAAAAVQAAEAAVGRAKLSVAECTVVAPSAGYVETLPWDVGELVQPGATLVRLVDIHEVTATFYVPNAEVGQISPGAEARVEADAWPDEAFTGKVSTITLTAEFTPRNIQTRSDRDRLVYPVEVRIPNADGRLRPGMPVQVTLPGTGR